ncbi:MAG: type II toxin-antitoxin system RelE/ParE family toxin [Methanobacteriota archaeon]|nr:MAG: type II toxin-antitoxin system RelE/ParE family toxin [Euryarchaeota archaeon]
MIYRLEYTARARKDLRKLERATAQRVIRSLHAITEDPYRHIKKLEGTKPEHPVYTYRIGLYYRAILSIHDNVLIIQVLEIDDRKQAYRDC